MLEGDAITGVRPSSRLEPKYKIAIFDKNLQILCKEYTVGFLFIEILHATTAPDDENGDGKQEDQDAGRDTNNDRDLIFWYSPFTNHPGSIKRRNHVAPFLNFIRKKINIFF